MKQSHDAHCIFLAQGGCDFVVTIIQTQLHWQHRQKQAVEKLYNQNNSIFRIVLKYTLVQIEQIKNSTSTTCIQLSHFIGPTILTPHFIN